MRRAIIPFAVKLTQDSEFVLPQTVTGVSDASSFLPNCPKGVRIDSFIFSLDWLDLNNLEH